MRAVLLIGGGPRVVPCKSGENFTQSRGTLPPGLFWPRFTQRQPAASHHREGSRTPSAMPTKDHGVLAMTQHGLCSSLDLRKVLSAAQLPALPQSAIRLLELSRDPATGAAEFTVPIEADGGLTSQVLRFVNSSYFGFSRRIASLKTAITLVGIRTIRDFALWSAVFSLMPDPKCGPFDLKGLWQDSLRRALLARATGKLLGMADAEEPFAAALFRTWRFPCWRRRPGSFKRRFGPRGTRQMRLSDLEKEVFGWSHANVAA